MTSTRAGDEIDLLESSFDKDRQFVTALARGLDVLRCFKPGERFLGNQEIARRTGLPKPTVTRLTHTLCKLGYLGYSEEFGRYYLGNAVLALSSSLLSNMDARVIARPLMRELADFAQASVSLGVHDGLSAVYIESCRSNAPSVFTLRLDVGSRIPLATTAMGRALIVAMPEKERDGVMDQIRNSNPEQWPAVRRGIEQALREFQESGFCMSLGDWQKDVHSVGVPLVIRESSEMYAFTCGGPAFQLKRQHLEEELAPRLVQLVRRVDNALAARR